MRANTKRNFTLPELASCTPGTRWRMNPGRQLKIIGGAAGWRTYVVLNEVGKEIARHCLPLGDLCNLLATRRTVA